MKKFKYEKKYLYWGVTAILVIIAAILANNILSRWDVTMRYAKMVAGAIRPIIFGVVIAYVLNPLMGVYEKYIFSKLFGKLFKKNVKSAKNAARGASLFLTVVTAVAIVAGLLMLIIPELYTNVERLVTNMPTYSQRGFEFIKKFSNDYPEVSNYIEARYQEGATHLLAWAREKLLPNANTLLTSLSVGIYGTLKTLLHIIIGVIVSVYILSSKEHYAAVGKKLLYGFTKEEYAQKVIRFVKYVDERFGGFLIGKIVDSAIVGVLCFIVCTIFQIPYALLVSVIVGVTNIIPFFGPFIGAIPSGILILLISPVKALIFAIIILVIQQIDGNIIGPKVLGNSTGLDSFGVMFAILFSGGLFGVAGMILGVPVFAVIFGMLDKICVKHLSEKNLPTNSDSYLENDDIKAIKKE
jgi:predicted PurR-regulated permease PerM